MHKQTFSFGSLEDLRARGGRVSVEGLMSASKEDKTEWMMNVLDAFGYTSLERDDKGLVRAYLQNATGYSRAQVARYIGVYQKTCSMSGQSRAPRVAFAMRMPFAFALALLLLVLTRSGTQQHASVLDVLNAERSTIDGTYLNAAALENSVERTVVIRTVVQQTDGSLVSTPLLAVSEQKVVMAGSVKASEVLIAPTTDTLRERVAQRRLARMRSLEDGQIAIRPDVTIEKEIYPAYTGATQHAAAGAAWDIPLTGKNGQILMIKNGQPVWHDFPYLEDIRNRAAHGTEMTRRAGGNRSGGAADSQPVTTATTQTTTTTAAPSGWTDGTSIVYLTTETANVGIGTTQTSNKLEVVGSISGASLYITGSMSGAGLTECDATFSKLVYDETTGRFACAIDQTVGTGLSVTTGDERYVRRSGSTMTGALVIDITNGLRNTLGLNVINTISGAVFHAEKSLTTSGTLVFEGAASGSSLYIATSINGAGLVDCDIAGTSKLLWDSTTGRFSCGTDADTDTNTTYTAGEGLSLNGTSFSLSDVLSGTLLEFQTVSGSTVYASKSLRSSGSLVWEGAASGASLWVSTFSGAGLTDCDLSTNKIVYDAATEKFSCAADTDTNTTYTAGRGLGLNGTSFSLNDTVTGSLLKFTTVSGSIVYGKNSLASSGTLVWEGAASGSSLYVASSIQGAGLTDCDLSTSVLRWDATTGRFSCATITTTAEVGTAGFTGAVLTIGNDRYINDNGDTMTGALVINVTNGLRNTLGLNVVNAISGAVIQASKTLASSGTLVWEGAASGATLVVSGQFSGAGLTDCDIAGTSKLLWDSATNRFSCAADTDTNTTYTAGRGLGLNGTSFSLNSIITGSLVRFTTLSGSVIYAKTSLASSGTLVWEGVASGASLYLGGSLQGAGLTDCDLSTNTLRWDATTGRFSCATITTTAEVGTTGFTGAVLTIGNDRYINDNGDTMTGALVINITNGLRNALGLNVINTISGAVIHAEKSLTSSGTLVFEGAASGSSLYIASSLNGAGLVDCDIAGTSKLLWDSTTGRFSCGTDADTDTNTTYTAGRGLGLNGTSFSLNSTITGALVRFGTVSGSTIYAKTSLASSGSLTWEGSASGASLWVSTFSGAGLTDCDLSTNKVVYDSATERFSCATDLNTGNTYTAGEGLSLNGTSFSLNDTITGALVRFSTLSGSSIFARNTLVSSGSLTVEGTSSFQGTVMLGHASSDAIMFIGTVFSNIVPFAADTSFIGTDDTYWSGLNVKDASFKNIASGAIIRADRLLASSGSLTWEGAASGASLWVSTFEGAGLTDCDAAGQTLNWDATNKRFVCGADESAGSGMDQNSADARYVRTSGSTMTGALVIDIRNGVRGTIGLNVVNAISGAIVHAEKSLTSSGTLVFEGAASGSSLYIASSFNGAGLTDCDVSSSVLRWDATTGRFSCATITTTAEVGTAGFTGAVLTIGNDRYINDNGDTMTGALVINITNGLRNTLGLNVINTVSGAVIHAEKSLTSSGTLSVRQQAVFGSGASFTNTQNQTIAMLAGTATGKRLSILGADSTVNKGGDIVMRAGNSFYSPDAIALGPNSPGTVANLGGGTIGWDNTANAASSDDAYSTVLIDDCIGSCTPQSDVLFASNYGFAVPLGAVIKGVQVQIERKFSQCSVGTSVIDDVVQLYTGASAGADRSSATTWTCSDTVATYGGPTDLWGLALTPSNVNASNFALALQVIGEGSTQGDAMVDSIQIVVYYSMSGYTGVQAGNVIIQAGSGSSPRIVLGSQYQHTIVLAGSGGNVGVGTTVPKAKLDVAGSMSGTILTLSNMHSCTLKTSATGAVICGTDGGNTYTAGRGLGLNGTTFSLNSTITGALVRFTTVSGSTVYAKNRLASSGSLTWEGAASGASLWVSTFEGAGLTDCDAAGQTLNWDATNKRFVCGADESAGSGMDQNSADARYVRTSGSTMTGALVIDIRNGVRGTIGLNVVNAISGAIVHAEKSLTSSGTLVWEGSASGASLWVSTFSGAGLTDCDLSTNKIIYDAATERFSCATDLNTGNTYTAAQGLGLNGTAFSLNSTITGSLVRFNTVSGSTIYAQTLVNASGSLAVDGTAYFNAASAFKLTHNGFFNCTALETDADGDVVCGADADTTYNAGQGLGLNGMIFTLNSTITGSLVRFSTISGSTIIAKNSIASSGSLVWEGSASGASLWVSTFSGAGLTDCDLSTSKLLYDSTTEKFSCGTIAESAPEVGTASFTGGVLTIGNDRYINDNGDTMTGALVINVTNGLRNTLGLNVMNAISGAVIQASKTLASSGTLVVEGAATFQGNISMAITNTISAAGGVGTNSITVYNGAGGISLSPTDAGSDTILAQGGLSVGNAAATTSANGLSVQGNTMLGITGVSPGSRLSVSGAIIVNPNGNIGTTAADAGLALEIIGTASGRVLRAQNTLASSGSLVWEGAASGASLYLGGSLQGAGLTDCDLSTSVLRWDSTTGRFSCGTIATTAPEVGTASFSGAVIRLGDNRWVKKQGDTMTGALVVNLTTGFVGLNVKQTISGSVIYASRSLMSSGTLVVESREVRGSGALTIIQHAEYGTGAYITASGSALLALDAVGKGSQTPHIAFGYAGNFDTNLYRSASSTLRTDGSLFVMNTVSGAVIRADRTLASSGTLAVEGATALNGAALLGDSANDILTVAGIFSSGGSIRFRSTISGTYLKVDRDISASGALTVRGATVLNGSINLGDSSADTINVAGIFSSGGSIRFRSTVSGTYLKADRALASSGTLSIHGLSTLNGSINLGDSSADTINVAGTFSSGGFIRFRTTVSGSVIKADRALSTSGTLTVRGASILNGSVNLGDASSDLINVAGTFFSGSHIRFRSTISGSSLKIDRNISASGSLFLEGGLTGATIAGFGLTDCDSSLSRVLWDLTASRFSCGIIPTEVGTASFTGAVIRIGDSRYVNTSGDTMTGSLVVNLQSGFVGLNVKQTASGSRIYASTSLASSGTLVVEGSSLNGSGVLTVVQNTEHGTGAYIYSSGSILALDAYSRTGANKHILFGYRGSFDTNLYRAGTSMLKTDGTFVAGTTLASSGTLVWEGAASGATLVVSGQFSGAGLTDCDVAGTSKLLWDATTGRFSCGTDTDTNTTYTAGRGLGLNGTSFSLNSIITGSLVRFTTLSGSTIYGKTSISSSGSLTWEGAASGASLYLGGSLQGAGLTDCDLSTQKLTWDASTNRFGCATINIAPEVGTASFSGAVFRLGNSKYVNISGDTMTGALTIQNGTTHSATTVALLNVRGTMSGRSLNISGTGSQPLLRTNITTGRIGIGTASPSATLHVVGPSTLSGGINALRISGTLDQNAEADGVLISVGASGNDSNTDTIQRAAMVTLSGDDYTGNGRTVGLEMVNDSRGVATDFVGFRGNFGFAGGALGTTNGANVAAFGNAENGGVNIGFFGRTTMDKANADNIGMVGLSRNLSAGGVEVGGYFGLNEINPVFESGALVVDNADSESPIILGRDDGRIVFSIQDGGNMRLGSGAGITARQNIFTSDSFNNEAVIINTDETTATQNIFRIISDVAGSNDNVFRIRADGSTFSDNAYSAAGADYAEWFYSTDALTKGEVVCIDVSRNNAVKRCSGDADSNVMGIVSTNPAFIGNTIGGADGIIPPGYALIGLIGQVPAKVIVENGEAIRPGDSLTAASTPGYARRARAGESTVGVALEGLTSGEGVVNVLISRRNQSLTVEAVEEKVLKTIAAMEIEDEVQIMVASTLEDLNVDNQITTEVERQLAGMQSQEIAIEAIRSELNTLKAELALIKAQSGSTTTVITQTGSYGKASSLEVDGTLTTGGDARIGGDLHIDGALNASSLFIPNGLSIDGGVVMRGLLDAMELRVASGAVIDGIMTVNGALVLGSGAYLDAGSGALSIGDLIVHNSLFVMGDVTIDGLATFLGNVEVKGELIVSGKQAGFAMIPKDGTSVTIHFGSGMTATPVVTATPNGPVFSPWWVSAPTQTGFTIQVASAVTQDTLFSWISLSTASPMTITAQVMSDGSLVFPTDDRGVPVSSNMVWNACIRNVILLDSEGQPLNCGRYHDQFTWMHPDLGISFIWNTSVTPPMLKIPDGYSVEVTESALSIEEAIGGEGDEEEEIEEIEDAEESEEPEETQETEDEVPSDASSSSSAASESSVSSLASESSASTAAEEGTSSSAASLAPETDVPEEISAE